MFARLFYLTMGFIYKMTNDKLPDYFNNFLIPNNQIHNYGTRSNQNFHIERTNYRFSMNSLFHKGLKNYNMLPDRVKSVYNVSRFRGELLVILRDLS